MMLVFLLLALAGSSCWGLQPGLEYQYRYQGRVAAGISSIKEQYAGAGIRADVTVQMTKEHLIGVQFANVEVGDYHGVLKCDPRVPLPIEYHAMEEGAAALLTKPFLIHLNVSEEYDYYEVPAEPAWVTNIRRSIVNIFRAAPLRVNFGSQDPSLLIPASSAVETTLAGHCRNWYTLMRLPEIVADRENQEREALVEDDIQRDPVRYTGDGTKGPTKKGGERTKTGHKSGGGGRKGMPPSSKTIYVPSFPTIHDSLWTMIRTLHFESCEDLVALKLHGHKNTDERISRTSVGTYLLRGDYNAWRIERVVVEGSVSAFADKYGTEHVDTFTNQTLELRAVRELRGEVLIETDLHSGDTWHYQVDHHLPDSLTDLGVHPIIEQVVTGVPTSDSLSRDACEVILVNIDALATHLTSSSPHPGIEISVEVGKIADAAAVLSSADIDGLEPLIEAGEHSHAKINIFHQALITAGTGPSISYLIEKMRDPSYRHDHSNTLQLLFDDIHNTVKNPLLVSKLVELVMTMTWDGLDESLKATGLMNVAKLANALCLNPEKRETFGTNTCDPEHTCDGQAILHTILPYLVEGLQDQDSPTWIRVIYVQAVINLGTPQVIDTLRSIILGVTETHIGVRTNAIIGLSPVHMPRTAFHTVFQLLMPIFDNVAEHYEVRNVAFLAMSMWNPLVPWWKRMAVSTWREPSAQVASFVSTTLKSLSTGREPVSKSATRVLHLAKPAALSSLIHSSVTYLYEYLYNCELQSKMNFAWLASTQSVFPSSVFLHLQDYTITGYTLETTIAIRQDILAEIWKILTYKGRSQRHDPHDEAFAIVNDMFEQIKEQLGVVPVPKKAEWSLWIKIQKVILSTQALIIGGIEGPIRPDPLLLAAFFGSTLDTLHFRRTVATNIALPTDLGLPFLLEYTEQQAANLDLVASGETSNGKSGKSISLKYDTSHDSTLEVKTLLPWSQNFAVGAGLHNVFSILVPLNIHGTLHLATKTLQFTVESGTTASVELATSHNHPYTVLAGAFPTAIHTHQRDWRVIRIADSELYSRHTHPLPSQLGLEVETTWTGDIDFPMNPNLFLTPSYKIWNYNILFHPEDCATKSISFVITYETLKRSGSISVPDELTGQHTQDTQKAGDIDDYSQTVQSSSGIQQIGDFVETIEVEQTSQSRALVAKLQREFLPDTGGLVNTLSVGVVLQGVPTRSYEAVLTWIVGTKPARPEEGVAKRRYSKAQLTLLQNIPEGQLGEAHVTCLKVQQERPFFLPMPSLEEVIHTKFFSVLEADLFDGVSCEQSPILKIRGISTVSEAELHRIQGLIPPEGPGCHGVHALHHTDLITPSIFDHAHFNISWTQEYPENLLNVTYYLDDHLRTAFSSRLSMDHTARNPDNLIEIDASKNPLTNLWTIRTTMPHEVSVIHDVVLTPPLTSSHGSKCARETFDLTQTEGDGYSVCVIEDTKVTTFDGQVLPLEPSDCWITADMYVTDQSEGVDESAGVFQVRYTEEWEFRCLWPAKRLLIDMTRTNVLVNGVEYDDRHEELHVHRLENGILLIFDTGTAVRVTDKVEIMESTAFRSKLIGLCGNIDGEKTFEMVGPLGCIYTDPALYALAWTTSGGSCNAFSLRSQKLKLVQFQESCKRRTYVPTGVLCEKAGFDCTAWEYKEQRFDHYTCKALTPTPTCKPSCKEMFHITRDIEYDCEVESHHYHHQQVEGVPKKCYSHILSTSYPSGCIPADHRLEVEES